jgi:CDP-paratose synthetase
MSLLPRVLLTGATGFLGSHLLEALLNKGHEVVILKRSSSNIYRIQNKIDNVISYDVDLQPLDLAFEEQEIDVVIHTAGRYGRDGCSITKIIESNVMFGVKLLDACQKYNIDTFINTDTLLQSCVDNYSLSKKHFSDWLKQCSDEVQIINLKLEHMYGIKDDNNKFVVWILSQLKNNVAEIKLTPGGQKRDFIYVSDVVSAFLTVLDENKALPRFSEFEVGTGRSISVREFVERILYFYQKSDSKSQTKLLFGAIPYRKGEAMSVNVNITSLKKIGWQPKVSIDEGLVRIIKELS